MAINEYDELLENMDNEQQGKISKPVANEYDELLTREESAFGETIKQGHAKAPEVSTQVLDIQKKTGLPAAFVEQNLEPLKQKQLKAEAEDFRRAHPITGQWLAESPYRSSIAKDDIDNLGALERGYRAFTGGWKKASLQEELAGFLSTELDGWDFAPGSPQARKMAELKAQMKALGEEEKGYSTGSYIANVTGYSVRQFGSSFKESAEGGLAGGLFGGGVGSVVPGVGTAVGTAAGVTSGVTTASGNYAYRLESAFAFDEFREMKDLEGNPLDAETARNAARGVGVVNATIEVASTLGFLHLIPGVKVVIGKALGVDAAKQAIRQQVKSALANPTKRAAVLAALGKMGSGASIEGLEEFFQELVGSGGREVAQSISGQEFDPDSFALDIQRAAGAGQDAAVGTFFTLSPLGGAEFYTQLGEVKRAERGRQFFEALGQTADASTVRERLPEAYEQIVERLTKDGPVETVYAPVEAWNTYWQGKGVDPKAIAEEVLGDTRSYDEAIVSGGDIPIPLPRYARKIAPTEHNVFFLDELRMSPTAMNARESRDLMEKFKEMEEEQSSKDAAAESKDTSIEIGNIVTQQLMSSGFDESTARAQAGLYESAFRNLGQRAGIDPMQLFNRYGLNIQRGEQQIPAAPPEPDLAKWEEEGGFAPGEIPESVDALSAKLGIEFGPEAAGIVKGVFLPRRVAINEDGSLNLTNSQKTTLELMRGEVEQGEAGFRHFREGDIGGDQVVTAVPSTFPEYFKNKGYAKAETLTAIEKALAGLPLGSRQASIVQDLNEGYRAQAFEELRRIRAERVPQRELSDEEVAALSPEEFSRMFFQGAPDDTQLDALFAKVAGDVWTGKRESDEVVPVGYTPEVLQRLGAKKLPLVIPPSVITKMGKGKHGLPFKVIENLPTELRDPLMVFDSATEENAMVVITRIHEGKPVIAAVHLDRDEKRYRVNKIASVHDKEIGEIRGFLEKGLLRYWDAEKAKGWLQSHGLQSFEPMPAEGTTPSSKNILSKADIVKNQKKVFEQSSYRPVTLDTLAHEGHNEAVVAKALMDRAGLGAESIRNILISEPLRTEPDRLGSIPSLTPVLTQMRRAILDEPKILDAIVSSVPVDMVNDLFGSEAAAKMALHDEAMLQDSPAFNADLPIASGRDTSSSVGLLLREVAFKAAEVVRVALGTGLKPSEGGPAVGTGKGYSFSQDEPPIKRASITFHNTGISKLVNIKLLKNADLSSFLHETGHFYLEVLGDLAQDPATPQTIRDDYATILDWLEVKDRKEIKTEHHEKWARGFEAYLMEGNAPTPALRAAFARFRAWLVAIYRNIARLDVQLSPEVKDVMDRLLASEEEIRIAQQKQNIIPLFTDPAALGMSEAEATRYTKAIEEAQQSAEEELATKVMAQVNREMKSWWKEERAKVRETVKEEVDAMPIYIALSVLQSTTANLPEGVTPAKLAKKSIVELFGGEARLKTLPKPYVYSAEGGMHPDDAADLFGFHSGDELLDALANAEPRKSVIERLTDERMQALHPDLPTDPAKLSEEAMKAVHNEKREELLRLELEHLAANNLPALKGMIRKIARKVPSQESMRAFAEQAIAGKAEKDIKPYLHARAEARAARKAMEAFTNGEFDLAFHMKLQEAMAHELYKAAIKAREEVDKIVEYAKKFDKTTVRERMGKAGADYLEQIDAILDRYSFKTTTLKALERRKSLLAWTKEQEAEGLSVVIPDSLLAEGVRQHYRETTVEELRGVRDAIKQIEHLANLKNRLLSNLRKRDFAEAQDEIVASIEAHHEIEPEPMDFAPSLGKRMFKKVKKLAASHTKLEFLFEFLDGNKAHGTVWEYLFAPFVEADAAKSRMNRDVAENMRRIFSAYTRKERALWYWKKTHIPVIGKAMNKANMLAVALNQGNLYNRQAIMDGYGWNEDQVQAVLNHLDKRDWETVQAIWDYIDSFWPEVKRLEEEISGLAPEKVLAAPVKTKFGEYAGGYYPIVFDRDKSWRQTQLTEEEQVREMFGGKRGRAMTKHGHTIERTNTGGKPVLLELTGMTEHIENVIHDIAYRRAIIDTWRLVNGERVRQAIIGAAGSEMYAQISPWLRSIAADRRKEPTAHFETLFSKARHGATIVNMGWKLTTAMVQFMGYSVTIKELGAKYAALGLKDAFLRPYKLADQWAFISERSEFMKERPRNYDRDVRDTLRGMGAIGKQGAGSVVDAYTVKVRSSWFALIAYMDMAVSIPTWLGAYRKAMDGKEENIKPGDEVAAVEFADRTVRMSQSSGAAKDLSAIQTGSEMWRMFTMFYSFFSLLFNQFGKTYTQFRFDRNVPKLMASLFLLWFAPAVLEDLLLGRGPDDDDDDEAWIKWAAKNEAMYPFQTVVLARDLVNGMDRFGYEPSPAFDMAEKATKTGKLGIDLATGEEEEVSRTNLKDAVMLVGYFAQLPTRQLWLTGEYFHDWMTGEQEPESVMEGLWRGLVTGKKRE